jgi:hypothetical protein
LRSTQVVGRSQLRRARLVDRVDQTRDFGQSCPARRRQAPLPGDEPEASVVWADEQRLHHPQVDDRVGQAGHRVFLRQIGAVDTRHRHQPHRLRVGGRGQLLDVVEVVTRPISFRKPFPEPTRRAVFLRFVLAIEGRDRRFEVGRAIELGHRSTWRNGAAISNWRATCITHELDSHKVVPERSGRLRAPVPSASVRTKRG